MFLLVKFVSRFTIYTVFTSRTLFTLVTLVALWPLNRTEVFGHSVSIGDNEVAIGIDFSVCDTDTVCTLNITKVGGYTCGKCDFKMSVFVNGDCGYTVTFISFFALNIAEVKLLTIGKGNYKFIFNKFNLGNTRACCTFERCQPLFFGAYKTVFLGNIVCRVAVCAIDTCCLNASILVTDLPVAISIDIRCKTVFTICSVGAVSPIGTCCLHTSIGFTNLPITISIDERS